MVERKILHRLRAVAASLRVHTMNSPTSVNATTYIAYIDAPPRKAFDRICLPPLLRRPPPPFQDFFFMKSRICLMPYLLYLYLHVNCVIRQPTVWKRRYIWGAHAFLNTASSFVYIWNLKLSEEQDFTFTTTPIGHEMEFAGLNQNGWCEESSITKITTFSRPLNQGNIQTSIALKKHLGLFW